MQTNCLVLFSGGLDSILACKVLEEQGIRPIALRFITPFFGLNLYDEDKAGAEAEKAMEKYGIEMQVIDISLEYLAMVPNPPHGYGRHLNPCIDCKILMVKKAISMLDHFNASFVATGEVLGQRPMSQRRDTLRIIERDSSAHGLLLRPLSARFLPETIPERQGIINRELLPSISGRSRKAQIALAKQYKIKDYPAPAGGCVLADKIIANRFRKIFTQWPDFTAEDCILAQVGRHFLLQDMSWLTVGRNQDENARLQHITLDSDIQIRLVDNPGPYSVIRYLKTRDALEQAVQLIARYCRHGRGQAMKFLATCSETGLKTSISTEHPLTDWQIDAMRF